jgi:predicted nucleic acid-binding protein
VIVVDASLIVDVLLQSDDAEALSARLLDPGQMLNAPHLLDIEVAQALRRYARIGDIDAARGRAALEDLVDLPIERYPHGLLVTRVWTYRNNLTAYDATYLALAEALDCPVWTRDRRFAASPVARGRILVV